MIKLYKENGCIYLTQDLNGLDLYERTKAIDNFIKKETNTLERIVDSEIIKIFNRNGVNVYSTDKSVLNQAFDTLKRKGKAIDIVDLYDADELYKCVKVGTSAGKINVWLEDDRYLQCGICVKERKL